MATIKDVSRLANVSISTVSRVINKSAKVAPAKEAAVLKAMEELNFQPNSFAQALVSKRSNCIGVLVGDLCGGPFFAQMMRGIENIILPENKYVIVMSGNHEHDREKDSIDALLLRRCDALIVHSKALSDEELLEINKSNIPMVFVNRLIPEIKALCVWVDISKGLESAMELLIKKGHKRIAYLSSDEKSNPDAQSRLEGYKHALKKANISFDENLVSYAFPSENGGSVAVENLLKKSADFTAVVAYNDAMAIGAVSALEAANLSVPSKVSVIGYDNNPITNYIKPKLTTVQYPIEEVGMRAAKLALDILKKRDEQDKKKDNNSDDENVEPFEISYEGLKFEPVIVERDSVTEIA